jgi:deoxyribodipyrimidine photo-lyase
MIEIVEKERIRNLNNKPENKNGKYVLYFMQASQRIEYNHALIYAIEKANQNNLPLLVGFSIMPYFPNANIRHYNFMLEGIDELSKKFDKLNINFVIKFGKYEDVIFELSKEAFLTVTDYGYLKFQREIRRKAAGKIQNKLIAVEGSV